MDENAVQGPVDPQLGQFPAASILKVVQEKPIAELEDEAAEAVASELTGGK